MNAHLKPREEFDKNTIELMSKFMVNFPTDQEFDMITRLRMLINGEFMDTDLAQATKDEYLRSIIKKLTFFEYVETENAIWYKVTRLGKVAIIAGGHLKYQELINQQNLKEKERIERRDESEKLDLRIKKWQIEFWWVPYLISILALIVSILSYLCPLPKSL